MDERIAYIINEYYQIIKSKISKQSFESALGSIDKLLSNFPNEANGYYYKGVCDFALERYDDAIQWYLKALSFNIVHGKAYFNLGVAYYLKNEFDNALINIAKALIVFSKQRELDCKKRCVDALNFIQTERKAFS